MRPASTKPDSVSCNEASSDFCPRRAYPTHPADHVPGRLKWLSHQPSPRPFPGSTGTMANLTLTLALHTLLARGFLALTLLDDCVLDTAGRRRSAQDHHTPVEHRGPGAICQG